MNIKLDRAPISSALAMLMVCLAIVSACAGEPVGTSSANAGAQPPDDGNPSSSIQISSPVATGGPVTGHVGDTLTFHTYGGDNEVDGTLVKVFDPAVPTSSSDKLPAGVHWVGVELTLNNHSSDYMNEASALDATTSDGTVLTTDDVYQGSTHILSQFQGCTQTAEGEQDVQPYTHCATFVVPDGQTLTQVGAKAGEIVTFNLLATDQAIWLIP